MTHPMIATNQINSKNFIVCSFQFNFHMKLLILFHSIFKIIQEMKFVQLFDMTSVKFKNVDGSVKEAIKTILWSIVYKLDKY